MEEKFGWEAFISKLYFFILDGAHLRGAPAEFKVRL
jgi:hypothetical protein